MPEVILGLAFQQNGGTPTQWEWRNGSGTVELPFDVACQQVAAHFNCTPEDAAESLLKHGYASEPGRHWAIKTDKIQGRVDSVGPNGERIEGDRW